MSFGALFRAESPKQHLLLYEHLFFSTLKSYFPRECHETAFSGEPLLNRVYFSLLPSSNSAHVVNFLIFLSVTVQSY